MFRRQNLCPRSKNVFDSRQKHFFVFRGAKFVSAAMFPSLARPLQRVKPGFHSRREHKRKHKCKDQNCSFSSCLRLCLRSLLVLTLLLVFA